RQRPGRVPAPALGHLADRRRPGRRLPAPAPRRPLRAARRALRGARPGARGGDREPGLQHPGRAAGRGRHGRGQPGHAARAPRPRLRGAHVPRHRGVRERLGRPDLHHPPDPSGMKNLTPAELAAVGAVDRDRIAADLAAVVAHPSLTGAEGEVQTEMALRVTTAGLEVERVDTAAADLASDPDFPGVEVARDSHPVVAGRIGDGESGRRAIVAGHVDVVGGGDELQWTSPPFEPRIADGLLFGRGACDMKAGVIAGLAAMRALVESGAELGGEAMLLTVPGEEDGGAGMLAAIRAGYAGGVAVITEPTDLQIVTAQ